MYLITYCLVKEIGQLLAGNLTNEDEDEVEAELAQILKVCI